MLVVADRVKQTSITQGSGTIIFNSTFGAFQSFSEAIGDGNSTYYVIENNGNFEVGVGTYIESTDSLSRDTILASSNNNYPIDLVGVSLVFCTYPANKAIFNDDYRLYDNRDPNPHNHLISDIVDLQSTLDSKQPSGSYASNIHNHYSTDILDFATAVSSVAPPTTDASLLTTGTLNDNRLSTNVVFTNDSRLSDARNPLSHNHIISEVSGLQLALDGKQPSGSYASLSHSHEITDVSNLQTVLDGKQPSGSYASSSHNHNIEDVSGLQTALDGKQSSGNYANSVHSHTSSAITDFNSSVSGLLGNIYAPLNSPTLTGIPLTPTANSGTNTNQIASTSFVRTEISNLV
ncbi:MAG: hypothetical protein EBU90_10720, partial [Proteobacteria bacterium]|nr:hypothetical protein [Pseudomonadota bacterium]